MARIDKYFVGWADDVQPERMNDVMDTYNEKAGRIGGDRALNALGLQLAFNLKNPDILEAIKHRGAKITGSIIKKTLKDFRKHFQRAHNSIALCFS